mgnify:CR=1 FL=1
MLIAVIPANHRVKRGEEPESIFSDRSKMDSSFRWSDIYGSALCIGGFFDKPPRSVSRPAHFLNNSLASGRLSPRKIRRYSGYTWCCALEGDASWLTRRTQPADNEDLKDQ